MAGAQGTDFSKLTLIPPADFSGTVDLTLSAFTLDKGLTLPLKPVRASPSIRWGCGHH